ncbi:MULTISPECIES: GntR family transcriptional regulator [unclassified Crossiella]|uniref:GntR family transcriptional regulator n=1 Tax=unclassified Crossiella TaxID=2620835 RepID=UPI001FFFAB54|nr:MULTISPECIES: GntR family transcriptional regulator [unclassified Crossiella]MCK2238422.1 GntR family transcriptional regulator [Crossiella sp. S99.2]MCK2256462.1 GntR family transcriptional regulator [Crossiella sp. S99.1]
MALAAEKAYQTLRAGILDGTHQPAQRLAEVELAEGLGLSRTPVREALRRLEVEGLVELEPHRGARVAQWTRADVEELYDLRMLLESFVAARAATRIGQGALARLAQLRDIMAAAATAGAAQDLTRVAEANCEFHTIIGAAAASPRVLTMLTTVIEMPLVLRTFHDYQPAELARSLSHHRELVDALTEGDPDWAEAVMRAHVLAAKRVLLRVYTR